MKRDLRGTLTICHAIMMEKTIPWGCKVSDCIYYESLSDKIMSCKYHTGTIETANSIDMNIPLCGYPQVGKEDNI